MSKYDKKTGANSKEEKKWVFRNDSLSMLAPYQRPRTRMEEYRVTA